MRVLPRVRAEGRRHWDIVESTPPANNGVDNIRSLREGSQFHAAAARYRVYIIDEVHMLSVGAFNALSKRWKSRRRM